MKKIAFCLIIVLAFLLRFFWLTKNPPALGIDEVNIGYNACSILQTGKDEYGKVLPLLFRSYDDYKPPLYVYLVAASQLFFGPTDFSVRFPSAILGVFAVIVTYFLSKELLKNEKAAFLASFLLAISPWHLQFTRTAYEVGSTAFFTSLGLFLFLKKKWVLSAVIFGLELYLYQATRVFIPLLLIALLLKNFSKSFIVVFALFFIPVAALSFTSQGQARLKGTSVFQDPFEGYRPHETNVRYQVTDWLNRDRISAQLFHFSTFEYLPTVINGYLSHFRGDFLFLGNNDSKTDFVPGVGLMYLWELPLLILGLFYLFKNQPKAAWIISAWVLLAPLPAALTYGVPTAVRSAIVLPAYQIVTAFGIISFFRSKKYLVIPLILSSLYFLLFYLHMSYEHGVKINSKDWYYSYKQVVEETGKIAPNYTQVIVSTKLDQPHGFFLYYLKYDPKKYIAEGGTVSGNFSEDKNHFANYFFKPIKWDTMQNYKNTLFIGRPDEFPADYPVINTFSYLDGKKSVVMVAKD